MKQFTKLACEKLVEHFSASEVVDAVGEACQHLASHPSDSAASAAKAAAVTAGAAGATALHPVVVFAALTLFLGSTFFDRRKHSKEEAEKHLIERELTALQNKLRDIARVQDDTARAQWIEEIIDARHRPLAHLNDEDRCYAYIASNAMATDPWDEFTRSQVLEGLGIVGNDSNERVRQIEKLVEQGEIRLIHEAWMFEQEYLCIIEISLRKGKVHGYDSEVAGKRTDKTLSDELPLEETFISLNLTEDAPGSSGAPMPFESVLDELGTGPDGRLLMRGYAGMGKSTLINWATRTAASGAADPARTFDGGSESLGSETDKQGKARPRIWRRRIPFRVRMRDCENWSIPADRSQFTALTGDGIPKAPAGWVEGVLRDGRAILFIDGLDEVPTVHRHASFEAIRVLIESNGNAVVAVDKNDPPGNLFVLSSRRLAEDPNWLKPLGFRQTLIAPLGRIDRDLLMGRWYDAAARAYPFRKIMYETKKQLIRDELAANPDVAQLTDSPLMCAVICNLCPTPDDRLPQQPQDVLELVCKLLASHRDLAYYETAGKPAWSKEFESLHYKGRKQIAASFAYEMLRANEPFLLEERAIALLREDFPRRGFDPERATKVLDEFALRVGLLRFLHPEKKRGVEFCHNVFKEFLAAAHVVAAKQEKREWLLKHLAQDDCRNALRHAIAAAASEDVCDFLVEGLLHGAEQPSALGRELRLLAVRSVPHGVSVQPDLRRRVAEIIESLVPPKTPEEADALAQVGHHLPDHAIRRLYYDFDLGEAQQLLNVRTLRQIRLTAAKEALQQYIEHADSMDVVLELASEVPILSIPWAWNRFITGRPYELIEWISDADMRRISREYTERGLMLLDSRVTDVGLTELARADTGLKALTQLELWGTQVTDAGLRDLARADTGLKALTQLRLGDTQVTDAGLKDLARADTGLKALTQLDLSGTQVTDAGLKDLARPDTGLKALTQLRLWRTPVTDAGLKDLARADTGLKALTQLRLGDTQATNAALKDLARADTGLKALTQLDLSGTQVTDAGLKDLARPDTALKALAQLGLSGTQVTDAGLKDLARPDTGLKGLTQLGLGITKMTDAGLMELARADTGLKALTQLDLSGTQVTDSGLKDLARADTGLKALTQLDLSGAQVTDAGLKDLARADTGLKALTQLDLSGTKVTDSGLKDLARADTGLKALTQLRLWGTQVTDAGLKDLARADTGLKALTQLDLHRRL